MRNFFVSITFLSALAAADTTSVSGSYFWIDSLKGTGGTTEKVLIVSAGPGQFEIGPWEGSPNDLKGTFFVNRTAGSLPVLIAPETLLHVRASLDTVVFKLVPQKPGKYFIRYTPDATTGITSRKPQAARSPIRWGKDAPYSILGQRRPASAPR